VFRTRWTAAAVRVGDPVIAGGPVVLELEDPRVVLVMKILVGDQLDIAARLRTDQWRPWPLPDEGPVVRVTNPQGCCSRLVAQLRMSLALWMAAGLHVSLSHICDQLRSSAAARVASRLRSRTLTRWLDSSGPPTLARG